MKKIIQIVLAIAIVALSYLLYESLMQPIRFQDDLNRRKALVVDRLKDIRTLQVAYKTENGQFAANMDTLIDFYKSGKLMVVRQVGSFDDSLAVALKQVYRDTVPVPVKDSLFVNRTNFNIDSLKYVPIVHVPFEMEATIHETMSRVKVPLFEARIPNDIWLQGLDRQLIVNLNDDLKKMNKYQGLKVGNVETPNNNAGNWE